MLFAYVLSLNATHLVQSLICMVRTDDDSFKQYEINAKDLEAILGVSVNTRLLRRLIKELTGFTLDYTTDEKTVILNMFDSMEFNHKSHAIKARFGVEMKHLLLNLDSFLKYQRSNTHNLGSHYIIRLYEICKNKLDATPQTRSSIVFTLNIEEFRTLVELDKKNNKGAYTYLYGTLKNRVFLEAVKQFKERTDIKIEILEEIKESRAVTALKIKVIRTKEVKAKTKPHIKFKK